MRECRDRSSPCSQIIRAPTFCHSPGICVHTGQGKDVGISKQRVLQEGWTVPSEVPLGKVQKGREAVQCKAHLDMKVVGEKLLSESQENSGEGLSQ